MSETAFRHSLFSLTESFSLVSKEGLAIQVNMVRSGSQHLLSLINDVLNENHPGRPATSGAGASESDQQCDQVYRKRIGQG